MMAINIDFFFFLYIGRSDEANKAFSAAVQLHDTLVKAWALWGDYLEAIFTQQHQGEGAVPERNMTLGVSAITCFLHACRHQNESKSRKYLAKVKCTLILNINKIFHCVFKMLGIVAAVI
jgi:transformation/transcription domain-associated protein